jgi:hypothetical protein
MIDLVPDIPHTAHWHCSYGFLLLQHTAYNHALAQFEIARQKAASSSSSPWRALEGLSRVSRYRDESKGGDTARGNVLLQEAIAAVPEGNVTNSEQGKYAAALTRMHSELALSVLYNETAEVSSRIQEAAVIARASYAQFPGDSNIRRTYIYCMYAAETSPLSRLWSAASWPALFQARATISIDC